MATVSTGPRADRPAGDALPDPQILPILVPRMARGIVVIVFGGLFVTGFLRILYATDEVTPVVSSALYSAVLLGLQLFYFRRPRRRRPDATTYLVLLVQAALVYLPMIFQFGQAWVGLPGFLAGSLLLALPPVAAWTGFAAVVASIAVAQWQFTGLFLDVSYATVSTIITGLVVYGLTWLAGLVVQLHNARNELAQLAVAQERLRFARDLHDLLGYSLSAITLKSELTRRLVLSQPDKAEDELAEVLDISRRALADVRAVASGYRELSLEAEARSARSVLVDAEVDVRMDIKYGELPMQVRTVLAIVLREGVTNVLRHSKAERCDITIRRERDQVRLEIGNDGVPEAPTEPAPHGGSGIQNLSVRVAALGGTLTTGVDEDGWFRLRATTPVPQRAGG